MKLLTVSLARVSLLFDVSLMNPKGISLQEIFNQLTERYHFSKAPQHPLDLNDQKALAFQAGTFSNSKKLPIGIGLLIYNNGVAADTFSSTDDCIEFLGDARSWLTTSFGLVIPEPSEMNRGYLSNVEVQSSISLGALNPKLAPFVKRIQSKAKLIDGKPRNFKVTSIACWAEDAFDLATHVAFRFERKIGVPFANNRYFSAASLSTKEHLEFLEEFEAIFRS
ncbi:MAG: hypothetical protein ACLQVM_02435 [Terriglobia bacterium]